MKRQVGRAVLPCAFVLGVVLVSSTCSDPLFEAGQEIQATLDIQNVMASSARVPIPVDSITVQLRHVSDSSLAAAVTLDPDSIGIATDGTVAFDLRVTLFTNPEEFHLYIAVLGDGVTWFEIQQRVTISTDEPTTTDSLTPLFVGPGANATEISISLSDTTITGGDSILVTGTVFEGQTAIPNAAVLFESSNEGMVVPRQVGRNQAWLKAPRALEDSIAVTGTALTRTGSLAAAGRLRFFARPDRLNLISGNGQSLSVRQVAEPLVVRVLDAAGNPFTRGYPISFTVASGPAGTSVVPASTTSDGEGYAQTILTAGDAAGVIQVSAAAVGLSNSPVMFTAAVEGATGPALVSIEQGDGQSATVGTAVPVAPAVLVTDVVGNPIADVSVTFAVESGGGSVAGASQTTNASGVATVSGWTLGTAAGSNTLSATVAQLSPAIFTATGTPDVPDTLVIVSGNNQSAEAGTALPDPLVVELRDQYTNPITGQTVTWAALHGSVNPTTGTTDASGQAQTSWTLGVNRQSQTATAAVTGLQPAVFSATAIFPTATILLDLIGADRISAGNSADMQITLTAPAPVGGVTITVTADNPNVVGVQPPGTVFFAEGETVGQIGLDGVAVGSTTVRATAVNYSDGALPVEVSAFVLSMPTTLNVPFGGTASLPIQISTPAQSGGEVVTLISNDPSAVAILTPTVTVPQGSQTANGRVSGVFPGSAVVTATSTTYGTAQSIVSSTANLNIIQGSANLNASFGTEVQVRLESGGSPIAAPTGGITVTFASADPTCLAATSPVSIPQGLVDASSSLAYGGSATLPCNTTLTASAPDITSDQIQVTVNPIPAISPGTRTVGSGLQADAYVSLGAYNHGGVDVVITSSNPAVMLVSPNSSTPGTESITVPVADGYGSVSYYVQGLENAPGFVTVTATAPGFTDGTATMPVVRSALQLINLGSTTTTLSPSSAFGVGVGIPDGNQTYMWEWQNVRAGAPAALTATLTSSDAAVAQLVTTATTGGSVTVEIVQGAYFSPYDVAGGGVALDPLTAGTTSVSASIPSFVTLPAATQSVTVSAPGISVNTRTVGSGLQADAYVTLGASNHGGVDVVIISSNPSVMLVSPNSTTPGTESITIPVADGNYYIYYYVQGVEDATGTATLTATAPGFTDGAATMTVVQSAIQLSNLGSSTTTLSPDSPFWVGVGVPDGNQTYMVEWQYLRAGAPAALTATVTSSDAAVAQLVTTATTGASVTVPIVEGVYYSPTSVAAGGVALDPLTAGTTSVSASIPGYVTLPTATQSVTVSAPGISVGTRTVGAGLQADAYVSLGATNHGGVDVVITSSNPSVTLVSPNSTTPGTESITIPLTDGNAYIYYYVQGVEGATGGATVTASAEGFSDGTATMTVVQPAIQLANLGSTTTTLSPNTQFWVGIGVPDGNRTYMVEWQNLRAGAPATLTATVTSSDAAVAQLVTTATTGASVTVPIVQGVYYSPTSVAAGGVALDPLTAGTTSVSASIPGFVTLPTATQSVTVSAPGISVGSRTVGAGLQADTYVSLGATNHGGVDVVITSSNPSVMLVSPNSSTPGTASITIPLTDGNAYIYYYVQGVENATGTAIVTASASGFVDGTASISVVEPALRISSLGTSTTASSQDVPFWVGVGVPDAGRTSLVEWQNLRAGAPASLSATVTSSNAAVGQLVTTTTTGASVTVTIVQGLYYSPTSVAAGGVAFDPVSTGTTIVSASIPGFYAVPAASVTVTVNP